MYEMAMHDWGVTPEYINRRWTEEQLTLMFRKRNARIERANEAMSGEGRKKRVSDEHLFGMMGVKPTMIN